MHGIKPDITAYSTQQPSFLGVRTFADYDLSLLGDRIDWSPFFSAWELAGRYPRILTDAVVGDQAQTLFARAQAMLKLIVSVKWLQAQGVIGFFAANSQGNDIQIYADNQRNKVAQTNYHLRQQDQKKSSVQPNYCLPDLIAPVDSGVQEYIAGFAVTTGHGIEAKIAEFKAGHEDYSAIMLKVLADLLAEAFAE